MQATVSTVARLNKFLASTKNMYHIQCQMILKQGGLDHLPPKFEHIFVVVITFSPFFCADTFITSLLLIVCASIKIICEMSL